VSITHNFNRNSEEENENRFRHFYDSFDRTSQFSEYGFSFMIVRESMLSKSRSEILFVQTYYEKQLVELLIERFCLNNHQNWKSITFFSLWVLCVLYTSSKTNKQRLRNSRSRSVSRESYPFACVLRPKRVVDRSPQLRMRRPIRADGEPRNRTHPETPTKYRYTRIPEICSEFAVGGSWILKIGSEHLPKCRFQFFRVSSDLGSGGLQY